MRLRFDDFEKRQRIVNVVKDKIWQTGSITLRKKSLLTWGNWGGLS
jgi:hypothetical protein